MSIAAKPVLYDFQCNEILYGAQQWVRGFICHNCGGEHFYVLKHANVRQCAACRTQSPVIAGTVFESAPVSLSVWFCAIDAIVNAHEHFVFSLAKLLDLPFGKAWLVKDRIERALKMPSQRELILEIAQSLR